MASDTCAVCGTEFASYRGKRYCSPGCRWKATHAPSERRYCPACNRFSLAPEDGCCPRCGEAAHREFELVEY